MEYTSKYDAKEQVSQKLLNVIRVVVFMIQKGISKTKMLELNLHLFFKRSNKIAGKAIGNLLSSSYSSHHHYHHHHHHHLLSSFTTCRSNEALSFISPQEYEFSCSNSPATTTFSRLHHNHRRYHHHKKSRLPISSYSYDDATMVAAGKKVLEMLNNEAAASPLPSYFPGFGKSPLVRQLRITDSPFPLKEEERECGDSDQVDKAAEEFIKRFYKDLKLQKITTSSSFVESPNYNHHDFWSR